MSWTFNEFQRELQKRNIDGPVAVMLTAMYEQQRETAEQVHMCAKLIEQLTNSVASFADLHAATQGHLADLHNRVMGDSSSVSSVPLTDEGDYN